MGGTQPVQRLHPPPFVSPQTTLSARFPFISTKWGPRRGVQGPETQVTLPDQACGSCRSRSAGGRPTHPPLPPGRAPELRFPGPSRCVRARPQAPAGSTKSLLCARSAPSPLVGLPGPPWGRVVASAPQGCRGREGGELAQKTNPAVSRFLQRELGQVGRGGSGATEGTNRLPGGAGDSPHAVTRPLAPLPPALLSRLGLAGGSGNRAGAALSPELPCRP